MCLPKILFLVCMFAYFYSLPLIFTLLAARICHLLTAVMKFSFFFQQISTPLFLISRYGPFAVIHVSVNIKNNVERLDFVVVFSP